MTKLFSNASCLNLFVNVCGGQHFREIVADHFAHDKPGNKKHPFVHEGDGKRKKNIYFSDSVPLFFCHNTLTTPESER